MKQMFGDEVAKATCLDISESHYNALVHLISNP